MNIIVTGASRGIGYELVKEFATDESNRIIAISRNASQLEKLKQECKTLKLKGYVFALPLDLTRPDAIPVFLSQYSKWMDCVDILVNNAGALINKPFPDLTEDDFEHVFDVNVKSVFRLIQVLVPYFNRGAHIVNISSMGGYQGSAKFPGLSLYSASKGALAVLSECLAEEFKSEGIFVNCLALGAVQTEMLAEAFPGYQAPVEPKDMAKFIADFAMNGHQFFNGKILPVSLSTP